MDRLVLRQFNFYPPEAGENEIDRALVPTTKDKNKIVGGLEVLFERHSDELFAYLVRYTGCRVTAEDILGDVYVRLIDELTEVSKNLLVFQK